MKYCIYNMMYVFMTKYIYPTFNNEPYFNAYRTRG